MWPDDLPLEFAPRDGHRAGLVTATVVRPIFHAVFERRCSWWGQPVDAAYALEHEQVHFAIAEYFARELTRKMISTGDRPRSRGFTRAEAIAKLHDRMRRLASQAMTDARSEHASYDFATTKDASHATHRKWMLRYDTLLTRAP